MKIEFYPYLVHGAEDVTEHINKLFIECANAIGLPLNVLERIIITDQNNWKVDCKMKLNT